MNPLDITEPKNQPASLPNSLCYYIEALHCLLRGVDACLPVGVLSLQFLLSLDKYWETCKKLPFEVLRDAPLGFQWFFMSVLIRNRH